MKPKVIVDNHIEINIRKIAGTPKEVEKAFGLDAGTLANLRADCKGPRYRKVGRKVIYIFKDVQEWLDQYVVQTRDSIG